MMTKQNDTTTGNEPTTVLSLIKKYGITKGGVARQLGKDPVMVRRALDPNRFGTVTHQHLYPIRTRISNLLSAAGWEGNASELWNEYDKKLAA